MSWGGVFPLCKDKQHEIGFSKWRSYSPLRIFITKEKRCTRFCARQVHGLFFLGEVPLKCFKTYNLVCQPKPIKNPYFPSYRSHTSLRFGWTEVHNTQPCRPPARPHPPSAAPPGAGSLPAFPDALPDWLNSRRKVSSDWLGLAAVAMTLLLGPGPSPGPAGNM